MTSRRRILLVDDSPVVRMAERLVLQGAADYELIEANDGREAVEKALAEQPDLILLDIVMPHMSGFEVCEKLRSEPKTADLPIIMVTTRGEAEHVECGYQSGCNDYVTKPIDGTELLEKIRNLLGE